MKSFFRASAVSLILSLSEASLLSAEKSDETEPAAVAIGKGSYAEFPPPHENVQNKNGKQVDTGSIRKILTQKLYIDPSLAGKPVPTNDWWTNLLHDRYSGNLWAYPLVLKATESGLQIHYPTEWNDGGNNMEPGPALLVSGKVKAVENRSWIVLADFESPDYPSGWKTSGKAFGKGPATGAIGNQTGISGFSGTSLVNSFTGGDQATGRLTSESFNIARKYLHFLIGGGEHPDQTYMELVVDGKSVLTATGNNSENLKPVTWDLTPYQNQNAVLRLVDEATGGWGHLCVDQLVLSNDALPPRAGAADAFLPEDARLLKAGDWTLTMRMFQDDKRMMDATFGRGLPYVWLECSGVNPVLSADGAEYLNSYGQEVDPAGAGSSLVIKLQNRFFAVFAAAGSKFELVEKTLSVTHPSGKVPFLVVAALPDISQFKLFQEHAFAVPRNSLFDWTYSSEAGEVKTTWKLETQALEGDQKETLQGWIPHHYRKTKNNLDFTKAEYGTPRGKLRCSTGTDFEITWQFNGIPPQLPAPVAQKDDPHSFQPDRMRYYLDAYADDPAGKKGKERYGKDTYWGGKSLVQYGEYAVMATLLGESVSVRKLQEALHDAMVDWCTYTPGEKENYFARYDSWKALIGFNPSYGSESFTDNHFHYGYFTMAGALLGMIEPEFLNDYGPMLRLIAKQYANWDRKDTDFPYLRTFDPWGGHSYAGGSSSTIGNNQESSSEAMQSWGGLFLLGMMMNDKEMNAAGAMGWAIEESATQEYWNDYYGWKEGADAANFPKGYGHSIAGIVGDQGMAFGTFFHGDPMFIYGIQWLPLSTSLYYLGRDPEFNRFQLDEMLKGQATKKSGFTFSDLKADWGNVTLGYAQFGDASKTVEQMDQLWDAQDEIARSKNIAGLTYYFAQSNKSLGTVAWDFHTNLPGSLVFRKGQALSVTVVAYQTGPQPVSCKVYQNGSPIGEFQVPSRQLTTHDVKVPPQP